jgi:hypothetical protein
MIATLIFKNEANVVVCRNTFEGGDLAHYYNENTTPILMRPTNPKLGLSSISVKSENGNLTFQFIRQNQDANQRYFNIQDETMLYMIVAFGSGKILN